MIPPHVHGRRTDGRIFLVGEGVFVCRYRLSTALPIPLDVDGPGAPRLVTWAFAGLDGTTAPFCLLVLAYPEGTVPPESGPITVETHFHELIVDCPPPLPIGDLPAGDRAILCGAVLAAITPGDLTALARFFSPFEPILSAWPTEPEAPVLTLATDTGTRAGLTGIVIPDYLLLRAGGIWSCARIARACQRFGSSPESDLTLEPAWGAPAGHPPDRAILLAPASARAARIAS